MRKEPVRPQNRSVREDRDPATDRLEAGSSSHLRRPSRPGPGGWWMAVPAIAYAVYVYLVLSVDVEGLKAGAWRLTADRYVAVTTRAGGTTGADEAAPRMNSALVGSKPGELEAVTFAGDQRAMIERTLESVPSTSPRAARRVVRSIEYLPGSNLTIVIADAGSELWQAKVATHLVTSVGSTR
jgi:hypothetical protein